MLGAPPRRKDADEGPPDPATRIGREVQQARRQRIWQSRCKIRKGNLTGVRSIMVKREPHQRIVLDKDGRFGIGLCESMVRGVNKPTSDGR